MVTKDRSELLFFQLSDLTSPKCDTTNLFRKGYLRGDSLSFK